MNSLKQIYLLKHLYFKKSNPNVPSIGDCYGFIPIYGMYAGYVRGDGQNYTGSVKLLNSEYAISEDIVEPIYKDKLTITEYLTKILFMIQKLSISVVKLVK